jgi:hypothetical protein
LTDFEAADWSMIDEAQPFWRLRDYRESRKLDNGQEYVWEKCAGTRPGQPLHPLSHLRWSVHN